MLYKYPVLLCHLSGVETAVRPDDVPNLSEASSSNTDIGSETHLHDH